MLLGSFRIQTSPLCANRSEEEELQASALVIGNGCLGQVGVGNKLQVLLFLC